MTRKGYPAGYANAIPFRRLSKRVLALSNWQVDIYAIRLQRIREIIATRFNGNKGQFADAIGRKRPNVYRLLSDTATDRRNVAEELARDIETKLGLRRGALDDRGPESSGPLIIAESTETYRLLSLWSCLFQEQKDELLARIVTEADRAKRIEQEMKKRGFDKFTPDQDVAKHIAPRPAQRELPLPDHGTVKAGRDTGGKKSKRGRG